MSGLSRWCCALVAGLSLAVIGRAQEAPKGGFELGRPDYPVMLAGNAYYVLLNPDGSEVRRWRGNNNNDGWLLPNGHLLGATSQAEEWDEQGNKVWEYVAKETTGGAIFSCQRLPNGNTLIAENSTGRVLEVTPEGEQVNCLQLPLNKSNRHQTLRMARRYPDGTTLVCRSGANTVELYNLMGECTWSQKVPGLAFAAVLDGERNVYIASLGQLQKWSPTHELLWEFKPQALGLPIVNMTGIHLLPNGNLVVGCYGYGPQHYGAFEVTPAKQLRWAYRSGRKWDSHMAVQLLDPAIQSPLR